MLSSIAHVPVVQLSKRFSSLKTHEKPRKSRVTNKKCTNKTSPSTPTSEFLFIDHPRTVQKTRRADFNIGTFNSKIHYVTTPCCVWSVSTFEVCLYSLFFWKSPNDMTSYLFKSFEITPLQRGDPDVCHDPLLCMVRFDFRGVFVLLVFLKITQWYDVLPFQILRNHTSTEGRPWRSGLSNWTSLCWLFVSKTEPLKIPKVRDFH